MEKKSGKKLSGLQNGAIRGLKIGASFRHYKSGQRGLQIGASLGISDRGKKIIKDFKSGQRDFRSGQRLQIEAKKFLNRDTDYKSGQNTSELR